MNDIESTYEAPVASPDPFTLPKEVRVKVKTSCCGGSEGSNKIEYLWIHAGRDGIGQPDGSGRVPVLEHWLNVVDEAASLGAKWLMLTLHSPLAESTEAVQLAQWAQSAHGMGIAIHTRVMALSEADIAELEMLDLTRVRLFVSADALEGMKALESRGIQVRLSEPRQAMPSKASGCGMPRNMLYVNAQGELYTCGMVNGNKDFKLGDIYSRPFGSVVADTSLQHSIPVETPFEDRGCEGCPPLLANALRGN